MSLNFVASQNRYKTDSAETDTLYLGLPLYIFPSTIGTSGQVLSVKSDLTGLEFVNQSSSSGYKGFFVTFSFTSAGSGTCLFSATEWDTESGLDYANDYYVVPTAGKWLFTTTYKQTTTATTNYITLVITNITTGVTINDKDSIPINGGTINTIVVTQMNCSVNDTIRVTYGTNISASAVTGHFSGHYLGN